MTNIMRKIAITCYKLLERKNHGVRGHSSFIIGNLADNKSYSKLNINYILEALVTDIQNYPD